MMALRANAQMIAKAKVKSAISTCRVCDLWQKVFSMLSCFLNALTVSGYVLRIIYVSLQCHHYTARRIGNSDRDAMCARRLKRRAVL